MEMGERGGWTLAVKRDSDFEWLMLSREGGKMGRSKRRRSGDKLDGRLAACPKLERRPRLEVSPRDVQPLGGLGSVWMMDG